MRYDEAGFARAFADKVGGADAAKAIHARARQIHGAALNVAIAYAGQRVASGFGAAQQHIWPSPVGGAGASGATPAAATLDALFGSLDTCGCDDCESILSAAAYFVDLLHYIDQPSPVSGANPQSVLFGRRPDLQYLPLSCANTETALPYIDIVNETLEYFVANGARIDGFQGFGTGDDVSSAELIAAPPQCQRRRLRQASGRVLSAAAAVQPAAGAVARADGRAWRLDRRRDGVAAQGRRAQWRDAGERRLWLVRTS